MYKNIVDTSFKWDNFTINEQNKILKSKRSNNYLDTTKLENKYKVKHISIAIFDCLQKIKKNKLQS